MLLLCVLFVAQGAADVLDYVDTRITTGGFGFGVGGQNPGPMTPFGCMRLGPDGSQGDGFLVFNHYGGYHFADTTIRAFSHTHLVGPGVADYGNIGVMAVKDISEAVVNLWGYKSHFSHETETSEPGFYSVFLQDPKVRVNLTSAGTHAGVHRYSFDSQHAEASSSSASGPSNIILIDVCHSVREEVDPTPCVDGFVNVDESNRRITGAVLHKGSLSGRNGVGVWIYFAAEFNADPVGFGVWSNFIVARQQETAHAKAGSLGAWFDFGVVQNIEVRVGLSFINASMASLNLATQAPASMSFQDFRARVQTQWRDVLQVVHVDDPSAMRDDLVSFYTNLYHAHTAPSTFSETGGVYRGYDNQTHVWANYPQSNYYTDMSIWDEHRSKMPLLALLQPDTALDITRSLVQMGKEGGSIPRWPLATIYTGCMVANHATVVIVDGYLKGITDFDVDAAYDLMRSQLTTPQTHGGRTDLANYLQLGYVCQENAHEAASLTLEYAFDDWAFGQLACALGKAEDCAHFTQVGQNYRSQWAADRELMCARTCNGTIVCPPVYEENIPYPADTGYIEGNAWQWFMFVPQDPEGLVELFGTKEAFNKKLETLFVKSLDWPLGNVLPNDFYWAGNEPDILAPWMFNAGGRGDLTQYWTRDTLLRYYNYNGSAGGGDSFPGNDDYGTLSAWAAFAALGVYPQSGSTRYFVGSPLFANVTLKRNQFGLSDISIIAHNASRSNMYLETATINGRTLDVTAPFLDHITDLSLSGGKTAVFELHMASKPPRTG